jgi:hypothetical protein
MHPEGLALENARGEGRGFVEPAAALEDLWIMQGSLCDLRCRHCYTESSPVNDRLQQIAAEELRPHLREAARFGVKKIWFTGGEVFVNEDVLRGRAERNEEFLKSLALAAEVAPVEILSNGRQHIRSHYAALLELRERVTLRITLESPREPEHDAIRGRGTFAQTVETVKELGAMGFVPVVTAERPLLREQEDGDIREAYRALFPGMRIEVNLIENMLDMVRTKPETFVTTGCFAILGKAPESLMCRFSRCIQKVDGAIRYYPCPVIWGDARFDLGGTLEESWRRVYTAHRNCYDYCLKGTGATCRTRPL